MGRNPAGEPIPFNFCHNSVTTLSQLCLDSVMPPILTPTALRLPLERDVNPRRVIQGHDGPLEFDEARQTVTKTYERVDHEVAVRLVKREIAHATRLHQAFARHDGLYCPRVLTWELSAPPRITMEICAGEPLSRFLRQVDRRDVRSAEIAAKIHDGLEIYFRLFDEPYHDLCFQNILYDEATGVLTFLDFDNRIDRNGKGSALEKSLGNLVGWACYDMARPSQFFSRRAYVDVIRATLSTFEGQVSRRRIRALARADYVRLTRNGRLARRAYYATAGTAIAALYMSYLGL